MQEEFGITAGAIWHVLDTEGEKKEVNGKTPVFDWAVGWLAGEDKIVITREKRAFRLRLKGTRARAAGASEG